MRKYRSANNNFIIGAGNFVYQRNLTLNTFITDFGTPPNLNLTAVGILLPPNKTFKVEQNLYFYINAVTATDSPICSLKMTYAGSAPHTYYAIESGDNLSMYLTLISQIEFSVSARSSEIIRGNNDGNTRIIPEFNVSANGSSGVVGEGWEVIISEITNV
jgi:hypothetical protein